MPVQKLIGEIRSNAERLKALMSEAIDFSGLGEN